jgi:hypothetical protein
LPIHRARAANLAAGAEKVAPVRNRDGARERKENPMKYYRGRRPEPTDECFIALVILIGPYAWCGEVGWTVATPPPSARRSSHR